MSSRVTSVILRRGLSTATQRQSLSPQHRYFLLSLKSYIRREHNAHVESVADVLSFLHEDQISLDVSLFNKLISFEKTMHRAFAIYGHLADLAGRSQVVPDAQTYSLLFEVTRKHYKPSYRAINQQNYHIVIPTPRQLFSDALVAHSHRHALTDATYTDLTPELLHVALRTFLEKRDFAGAYVALGSFQLYNLPATIATYSAVLQNVLVSLSFYCKAKGQKNRWARRLDIRDSREGIRLLNHDREKLVHSLLHVDDTVGRSRGEDYTPTDVPQYHVPTFSELENRSEDRYSIIPLRRLVRRALVAEAETIALQKGNPPFTSFEAKSAADYAILKAKNDMLVSATQKIMYFQSKT